MATKAAQHQTSHFKKIKKTGAPTPARLPSHQLTKGAALAGEYSGGIVRESDTQQVRDNPFSPFF